MKHRDLMRARSDATLDKAAYNGRVQAAIEALPLGHDVHGNTITFGQVRDMYLHWPSSAEGIAHIQDISDSVANVETAVDVYADLAQHNAAPQALAKAQRSIAGALTAYSLALEEAEHLIPGINEGHPKPFEALSHKAGEICEAIRKIAKAHAPEPAMVF